MKLENCKTVTGALPTAELRRIFQSFRYFVKIFWVHVPLAAHNFYPIEIQRIISPPLSLTKEMS